MSVQITDYRNLYTTLHLYLKNKVLRDWVGTELNAPLTYDTDLDLFVPEDYSDPDFEPKPNDRGRGWVYFDYPDLENEQNTVCSGVRDSGGALLVKDVDYEFNYAFGGIKKLAGADPDSIDIYTYNYIALVDEWRQTNTSSLPIVVVDIETLVKEGYQLGAGSKDRHGGSIHIFATTRAERDDLIEILFDSIYLKQLVPQDFSDGTPIDFDGTFNDGYQITTLYGTLSGCGLYFENVKSRVLQFNMVNDINEFRARITFDMQVYMT